MRVNLKLDIDFKNLKFFKQLGKQVNMINYLTGIVPLTFIAYETKHGFHVYLTLSSKRKFNQTDELLFQALLSDDYKRELFNWLRLKDFGDSENLLFFKKFDLISGELISQEKATIKSKEAINNFWVGYYEKPKKVLKFQGNYRERANLFLFFYSFYSKIKSRVRGFL
jgi:hypothetical protein